MTAAFDYSGLKTTADSLIDRFGKDVVLSRGSHESVNLDAWEQSQGPTSEDPAQSISGIRGVQIKLDRETLELQTIDRPMGRWVLQAASAIPDDVGPEWILSADGASFQIITLRPVKPGDTLLVYFATVAL